ncbi:MAG: hypothetical protein ABIB04_01305 [Patescibacteria group bacterium]
MRVSIASFFVAATIMMIFTLACGPDFYKIQIETPIPAKLDLSSFQRVLVAGFIAGGSEDIDANQETIRLLRSQLRIKAGLKVIDADAIPLMEIIQEQNKTIADRGWLSYNNSLVLQMPLPQRIKDEKDLELYERLFANVAYWKKIGEEYQNPLIVTGTILFTVYVRSGYMQTEQEIFDSMGRRQVALTRDYQERKGFVLRLKFIFIDGRTGATIHSETYREEILYAVDTAQQNKPALSLYFELMDRIMPEFLSTLSTRNIRGMRVLLK